MRNSKVFQEISTELLTRGHRIRFRAEGKSMHPTIRDGEVINVAPVAPYDVRRGDILLYRSAKSVIAHRVVAIVNPQSPFFSAQSSTLSPHYSFILRGDASDSCDEPVEAERLMGKVVAVEREGRSVALDSRWANIVRAVRARAARLTSTTRKP